MSEGEKTKLLWQNPEYRKHMSEAHKGHPAPKTTFKKGQHASPNTEFKKGHISWSKIHPELMPKMKKHWNWKGGKRKDINGYIWILKPNHPSCDPNGYIKEHRLIMEKMLGRYLRPEEVVHHKGDKFPIDSIENKQDNRRENLMLFPNNSEHRKIHKRKFLI